MLPPSVCFLMWKVWTRGEAPIIDDYEAVTNRTLCFIPRCSFCFPDPFSYTFVTLPLEHIYIIGNSCLNFPFLKKKNNGAQFEVHSLIRDSLAGCLAGRWWRPQL